jgi:hypothetical protein
MRDKESGGMDKALERHLDSDGKNCEGVEKRLGRDYGAMEGRRHSSKRGSKKKRSASSGRRGY